MTRWVKICAALALAIAVPATAQTFGFSLGATEPACLPIGNATYRITNSFRPDVTVRIDPAAGAPDIRVAIADTPDEADFVYVDDGERAGLSARGVQDRENRRGSGSTRSRRRFDRRGSVGPLPHLRALAPARR